VWILESAVLAGPGETRMIFKTAFLLRLEDRDVLCFEALDRIFELANVAISFFFAFRRSFALTGTVDGLSPGGMTAG